MRANCGYDFEGFCDLLEYIADRIVAELDTPGEQDANLAYRAFELCQLRLVLEDVLKTWGASRDDDGTGAADGYDRARQLASRIDTTNYTAALAALP